MQTDSATTAILLFARSAAREMHEKWLPKGEEIYSQLNKRARWLAQESGLVFFHSTEADQSGADFGARFAHSIKQIFDQGYTSVISIGNDTPQLTQNDIRNALEQLRSNKSVIGPSKDGGIYLLGIHASDYDPVEFSQLKWCTSKVQEDLAAYFRSKGQSLSILRPYNDLDTALDLHILLNIRGFIPISILNLLRLAVRRFIRWFDPPEIRSMQPLWQPNLNKGSPR